jgi:hypothetical protein
MSDREIAGRGGAVVRTLVSLLGIAGCLAAVAFAATPRQHGDPGLRGRTSSGTGSLPAPEITQHPDKMETSTSARFGFADRRPGLRFQCRLDRRGWRSCQAPLLFTGLAAGIHRFSVRARDNQGRRSRATRFRWRLLEPKDFSIQPELSSLSLLFPGAPPVALPLVIANPNPVPIFVTSLSVTTTGDPPGCAGAENLALGQSSLSSASPLKVPAGRSVSLPAAGVSPPSIQLRDLPVNQDACQNARFPLAFAGKARG